MQTCKTDYLKNLAKDAYDEFMRVEACELEDGWFDDAEMWPDFDTLSDLEQRRWMAVVQAVSDSTRGWIQRRISGPMEE